MGSCHRSAHSPFCQIGLVHSRGSMAMGSSKGEAPQGAVKNGAKPYGKIVLTLKNQLLPDEKLKSTPSQNDGLDNETETDLRIYGCELIQTAGILLKLPQVSTSYHY